MDVGLLAPAGAGRAATFARTIEDLGFASLVIPDSQNLAPEVWVQLVLAAKATSRLRLGPGVTNSVTRDPAVTACAAVTLQVESDGRAVLAIGRGDSSVQRIGKTQDPVARFERYVAQVQSYLRGEAVDRDGFPSQLEWLPHTKVAKVPVEVAATGRRVIAVAARQADRVCFAVGADPDHLATVLALARDEARAAGRDPATLCFGAYVTCVLHDDVAEAREAVRGAAATFARFSALPGSRLETLPEPLRQAAAYLRDHYDMRDHTRTGVAHTAGIPDEFVDWFGIVGPPERALPRFQRLAALGLEFVHVIPGSTGMSREIAFATLTSLSREIIPALGGAA
jgi:5,10-methylenetetrahydromethanopterin reductase